MDTMRIEYISWYDYEDDMYYSVWTDIDTGETFDSVSDAKEYAEENGLILEVIDNGY